MAVDYRTCRRKCVTFLSSAVWKEIWTVILKLLNIARVMWGSPVYLELDKLFIFPIDASKTVDITLGLALKLPRIMASVAAPATRVESRALHPDPWSFFAHNTRNCQLPFLRPPRGKDTTAECRQHKWLFLMMPWHQKISNTRNLCKWAWTTQ